MSTLLEKAYLQLESSGSHSLRQASWLARAALEEVIENYLKTKGISTDRASERAKLSCLEGAYIDDRAVAQTTEYAWCRLSEAWHQHAHQLSPTYAEVQHLVGLVDELSQGLSDERWI